VQPIGRWSAAALKRAQALVRDRRSRRAKRLLAEHHTPESGRAGH